ncbi:DUF3604 domain-containing protein [Microbacterium sp. YY-01]|uniref:DUF3604 domain-containing protein n=1 Tax=Microbacterium sp. YY-01 TaxID=3421634 RepID=UPI003D1875DB
MPLTRPTTTLQPYAGLTAYAGDLHNHCGISYGHGSIEEAYANAKQQLDFATVTGHAAWHDIPREPAHVYDYHLEGFARLASQWDHVQQVTENAHVDGEFVTFLSFEWHSLTYGDHCVYFRAGQAPLDISQAQSLEELREKLREFQKQGIPAFVLPHHIGYKNGWRGINWDTYTEELSPVVEIVSMHGSGENEPGPRPYLHTMGPRDGASTAQSGLARGNTFGFIGSTDHHSAHPGSYGYGKAMVWADSLTREGIWDAIAARRTYAVTGDRIMLATSVNGAPMGSVISAQGERHIEVDVLGGDQIDYVEVLRNNEIIAQARPTAKHTTEFNGMLAVSVGWGEYGVEADWDVTITVQGGRIESVDPRLHGDDVVDPTRKAGESTGESLSDWRLVDDHTITLRTHTSGNHTVMTDSTQQLGLHVIGDDDTVLEVVANGTRVERTVGQLRAGSHSEYTGGFLSPAILLHRAADHAQRSVQMSFTDPGSSDSTRDWYYVRVRQVNDQYAWSSPIWVERAQ